MLNDYILTPGEVEKDVCDISEINESEFLKVENALHEILESGTQASARSHLGVPSIQQLNTVQQELTDSLANAQQDIKSVYEGLQEQINNILNLLDLYATKDGEFNFNNSPTVNGSPLITDIQIELKLSQYDKSGKVDAKIANVLGVLDSYALKNDVYTKLQTYCSKKIDSILTDYLLKKDIYDYNFATTSSVNSAIRQHINSLDPHNFGTKLKEALKSYYKRSEVWPKSETYSRTQIDNLIDTLVEESTEGLIDNHINTTPHLTSQEVRDIIKLYANSNLVNNTDLEDALTEVDLNIKNNKPIWKTSGPVLTTVGFVEKDTVLPPEITMQLILDLIFYGSKMSIIADEKVRIGNTVDVTICLHIGVPIKSIILYMNGTKVDEFDLNEFIDGCITRPYGPITEDTEFVLKVTFSDDSLQEVSTKVSVGYPLFVGIIPNMKSESAITMNYLKELIKNDPLNNEFVDDIPIIHKYKFLDSNLLKVIVGIPNSYNLKLDYMSNQILKFTNEAFNFHLIGLTIAPFGTIIYDFYIYEQPLSSLNSEVTFNFISKE